MLYLRKFFLILSIFAISSSAYSNNLSIDNISFDDVNGKKFNLSKLPGRILLIVNTASYCGFTKQYKELQELSDTYSPKELSIIAIPSNDFGQQEPGSNEEIKDFCESKYGITFPVMSKQKIIGEDKHLFYSWIENNFGVNKLPRWNFHKYLINRDGELLYSMASHISPNSSKFIYNLENSLK